MAVETGDTAAHNATSITTTLNEGMRGMQGEGRRHNLGRRQIKGDSLRSTQVGELARRARHRAVKAGTTEQLRVLLAHPLAAHTRGDSRKDLRVRDPRLANLRVARRRGRGNGLSQMCLLTRVAHEPGDAFAAGLATQSAQQPRATLDQYVSL